MRCAKAELRLLLSTNEGPSQIMADGCGNPLKWLEALRLHGDLEMIVRCVRQLRRSHQVISPVSLFPDHGQLRRPSDLLDLAVLGRGQVPGRAWSLPGHEKSNTRHLGAWHGPGWESARNEPGWTGASWTAEWPGEGRGSCQGGNRARKNPGQAGCLAGVDGMRGWVRACGAAGLAHGR